MAKLKPRRRKARAEIVEPAFEPHNNISFGMLLVMTDEKGRLYRIDINAGTYELFKAK